ncbi:MAG TPA: hypothetical protein VKP66_22325 [Steroidobacteraceae bacterium]|nr:hypothetical protein [Steroidobacteraceae bacterium]
MPRSDRAAPDWSPRSQGIGVALWTSFLVACIETMIVFAFLDPVTLGFEGLSPSLSALRPMLYGCGFFLFWSFAFIAAGLTAYMIETSPRAKPPAAGSLRGESTAANPRAES